MKYFPVIRVTLLFAAGIALQSFFPVTLYFDLIILILFVSFSLLSFLLEKISTSAGITSLLVVLLAFLTGYTSGQLQRNAQNLIPDSVNIVKNFTAYGSIENLELPSDDGFSFVLKTDSISAERTLVTHVNLLCKVWSDSASSLFANLEPGNNVKIKGTYKKGRGEQNPGEYDYSKYLHSKNISGILNVYKMTDIKVISRDVNTLKSMIFSARKLFAEIITTLHSHETAALLKGLILADRSEINSETRDLFVNSGVVHILAVSGLHVGFIGLIFFVLLGRLNLYIRSFLTVVGLVLFMVITGIPASVFRAVVMAVVLITAFLLNRTSNIFNSLAIAAIILLAVDPSELFDPGFQLSFISVLSIAYSYPRFKNLIEKTGINNKILKYIFSLTFVSLSAQIGTLPVTLIYFGKVSVVALLVNLAVIPLAGVIIGTAVTTLIFYPFSLWVSAVYAAANNMFADLLLKLVKYAGSLEYSSVNLINFSYTNALIFYSFILGGICLVRYLKSSRAMVIFVILIAANIYIYSAPYKAEEVDKNNLNVFMLDVGQGDSFIIKFPDGENALIDAGNASQYYDYGERIIMPAMRKLGIEQFNYGFVSHIDADHYGGFISLIEKNKILKIFKPFPDSLSEKDFRFEQYLKNKKIPVEYYERRIIKTGNAEIFILNDDPGIIAGGNSLNNSSGIIKIVFGSTSFLFTGDIDKKGESFYEEKYKEFLDVDVLKVSHHGSRSGSSLPFIRSVSPQISLISCGIKNRFGHPAGEIVNRLKSEGSALFRTDMEGCVLIQSNGNKTSIIDWKNYY